MTINILINNGSLGRQGKTTVAYTLYKHANDSFKFVTNDLANASIDLEKHVEEGQLLHFPGGDEILIDDEDNHIFDFGGKPDDRLLSVAGFVDMIIIPLAYQSVSELKLTIENINAFLEHNKNIVLLINNTDVADAKIVITALSAVYPDIPILEISHSKFIRRLANEDKTVFEVAEQKKGDGKQLNKKIIPQFNALFKQLGINL